MIKKTLTTLLAIAAMIGLAQFAKAQESLERIYAEKFTEEEKNL